MPKQRNLLYWGRDLLSLYKMPPQQKVAREKKKTVKSTDDKVKNNADVVKTEVFRKTAPPKETKRNNIYAPGVGAPAKLIAHKYAEPAVSFLQDIIHKNVTVPIKRGIDSTLGTNLNSDYKERTENDFSDRFLNTLDSINISQLNKRVPDWKQRTAKGDTIVLGINGNDYIENYGGYKQRSLLERILNPVGQIETTLGSYTLKATKDNLQVSDIYDFNNKIHLKKGTTYSKIRELANTIATPDDAPDNEKIHINIKSKRTRK